MAALKSFSAAARALELPKSSISRAVTRLEKELGARLFQRTTREVTLTDTGTALQERCIDILYRVGETLDYVGGLRATPRGRLNVTAGIGFGINVLSELLPRFIERYPEVNVCVDLTSQAVDLRRGCGSCDPYGSDAVLAGRCKTPRQHPALLMRSAELFGKTRLT